MLQLSIKFFFFFLSDCATNLISLTSIVCRQIQWSRAEMSKTELKTWPHHFSDNIFFFFFGWTEAFHLYLQFSVTKGNFSIIFLKHTHWTHLGDAGHIWLVLELGDIVIDVLHLDDELWLGLLWFVGPPVDSLGLKDIKSLFLTIKFLQCPDLPRILIYFKHIPGAFPW